MAPKLNHQSRTIRKSAILGLVFALITGGALAFQNLSTVPTDSGFQSAGAYILSKDDNNTYDRSTDSLEAIRDKIDTLPWTANGSDIYFSTGNVGIGTTAPTDLFDVNGSAIRLRTSKTPSSASDTCDQGEISWDADYVYVCTATNTWKRSALATW